jgi:UDP-2,3-diacylglucosamine pyrophosphatase LpxH
MAIQHYDYPNAKSVVICGDIHGEFENLVYQCCVRYKMRDTLIIVAGDCGFGFDMRFSTLDGLTALIRRLVITNNRLVFVRGNHDDPAYFNGEHLAGMGRWRLVPDYSVLTACGHHILCVGGAVSIDRDVRTKDKDWWEDEKPVLDYGCLNQVYVAGYEIDTVVTHTAPSFCEFMMPPGVVYSEELLADMQEERRVMDGLLDCLRHDGHPLRRWFYGHFHHSWNAEIDGIIYTMLGIMEMKELR